MRADRLPAAPEHEMSRRSAILLSIGIISGALVAVDTSSMFAQKQFDTAAEIPRSLLKSHGSIYGKVVKVTDGDTIRIRHAPGGLRSIFGRRDAPGYRGKLSEHTISVRFYGVDAPETAKFGNPAMPFAYEAKDLVAESIAGRIVKVKLFSRDQYGRVVGKVQIRRSAFLPGLKYVLPPTDMTVLLSESGMATLYTGGGAQYDGNREKIESAIARAQRRKRGMWTQGKDTKIMTPAEYKRKYKR